ncbi:MAG TPA: hypothetical protein PKJ70_01065, partial [Chitinophagaceae bacterium]|nr:hypothetical protein [Chitinophagaceae bacterium]HNN30460.1 hypothetical protein [Chitinophagaceae bacterium]
MRKIILLMFIFLSGTFLAQSQTNVQIGTGTGTSTYFPIYYLYDYSYSQTIYSAAELTSGGATSSGMISKIFFKSTAAASTVGKWKNWTIYMANTAQQGFTGTSNYIPASTMTQVFNGDLPDNVSANVWIELTLSTPFLWDGSSHLAITVMDNTLGWGNAPTWSGYTATPISGALTRGIYFYQDGTTINPNSPSAVSSGTTNQIAQVQLEWTPASACSGTPTAGTAEAPLTVQCPNTSFGLALNGTTSASGLTYQWQSRPTSGGSWADIFGATTKSYTLTSGVSVNTDFRAYVTCTNGNLTDTSTVTSVTVSTLAAAGTYTINSSLPTSGSNFANFEDAYDFIKCGIAGPIVFNVAVGSGPYTITSPLKLPKINGTSATNTITFNGNGESILYNTSDANNRAAIVLNGADNIIIDSFTVDVSAGTYGWGIVLTNRADSNTIRKCTILTSTTATTTNYAGILITGSVTGPTTAGENGNDNLIENNRIVGGYYAITAIGTTTTLDSNNIIKNNLIEEYYYYGIYTSYEHNLQIIGNDFSRPTRTNPSTFGYSIYSTTGNVGVLIDKNKIHNLFTGLPVNTSTNYAIAVISAGTATYPHIISNNLIYNIEGNGTHYGIYNSSAAYTKIYHNTIALDYIGATAGITYGFYQTGNVNGIEFKNNIVFITRGGSGVKYAIYKSTAATPIASNNNVFFLGSAGSGTQNIGYQTSASADLITWQTTSGQDALSKAADPLFLNPSSGDYSTTEPTIDDMGAAVGVLKDINGINRSLTTPDPGAYEKPPSVGIDMKPVMMLTPITSTPGCYNTETLAVQIENNSVDSINFSINPVTVTINVTGAATATYTAIVNTGKLAPDSSLNVTMTTPGATLNMSTAGAYNFDISTSVTGDVNSANNLISTTRTKISLTAGTIASSQTELCASGTPPLFTLTNAEGYSSIKWQVSNTSGSGFTDIPGANSLTYTLGAVPISTKYFRVVATCGSTDVNSPELTITVVNPQITSTTPGSRCGPGTVNLSALATGFDVRWYADSVGGAPLYTGNAFTTPIINATDTFYAAAINNPTPVPPVVVGAGGTTSSSYESPYYYLYGNKLSQYLFRASELTALGMTAGSITSVAFDVVSAASSYSNFSISFKSTNATDMSLTLESGLTTVYTSAMETPTAGVNTYSFSSTPFAWDGASNIIMQICWGNSTSGGTSATVKMDATSFAANAYYRVDGAMPVTFCNTTAANGTTNSRPQTTFGFDASCVGSRVPVIATINTPPAIVASVINDSICSGQSTTISVSSSNSGYTYTWDPGSLIGASHSVAPLTKTKYIVNANDASGGMYNGCTNKDSVEIVVKPVPTAVTPSSTPGTICTSNGEIAKLVANGGNIGGEFTFGTAAAQNISSGYPAPYTAYYGGQRMQMLITAAELTGQGVQAGLLNSISFPVVSLGANWGGSITSCIDFQMSVGATSLTTLTAFQSGLTQVVAPGNYTPTVGNNNVHTFTTPFMWDGVSNLIIETTFSNNFLGGTSDAVIQYNTTTSYKSTIVYRADSKTPAAIASGTTVSLSFNARPDFILNSSLPTTFVWSPLTGLFTDAAATIPYTGTSLDTVYAKPASTTTYAVSSTTAENCSVNGTVNVTVDCSVPVTYTMFTGKREGMVNMLSWQTA